MCREECDSCDWGNDPRYVDYEKIYNSRYSVLRKAFQRFGGNDEYETFCKKEKHWLENYCLFMAIKQAQGGSLWTTWDKEIRGKKEEKIAAMKEELKEEIAFQRFMQYEFDRQWKKLKQYANEKGITIIGDLPIYVALDSADAWATPELFQMDSEGCPGAVAGCPPDAFSATGQLWGNPLYDWEYHKKTGYAWWVARMKRSFELYDTVRIDHFRGFSDYYAVPAGEDTAVNGCWKPGPGMDLFNTLKEKLGDIDVIAEDLGTLDDKVFKLLEESGFPGMKVLQFAFDSGPKNFYLPHHYTRNCVVYTGTHDNDTTKAWYYSMQQYARDFSMLYLNNYNREWEDIPWDFIRAAEASVANLAVIPIWDILCCGSEGRMNCPATVGQNWKWRMVKGELKDNMLERLRWMTDAFQRLPLTPEEKEALKKAGKQ